MSLLRLLTTGKSLVGLKDTESRYQVTSQRLLPRFGTARNPFSSSVKSGSTQPETCEPRVQRADGVSVETRAVPSWSRKPVASLQIGVPQKTVSAETKRLGLVKSLWCGSILLLSRYRAKLSSLVRHPRTETVKPTVPRFTKQPVQGELSLEKIKVARNDLSDADLEVVPTLRPVAPVSVAADVQTEPRPGPVVSKWGRVTTRIFGAGKT